MMYIGNTKYKILEDGVRASFKLPSAALPYDAEIEYLENTGTAYFILPLSVRKYDAFGITLDFLPKQTTTNKYLLYAGTPAQFYARVYSYNSDTTLITFATSVGGVTTNGGIGTYYNTRTQWLLSTTYKNTTAVNRPITQPFNSLRVLYSYLGAVFGMTVTHNNTLIYNLIPVRVGQTGYMYDKVSGQLFGNAGTGNFVLGNDITT